MKDFPLEVVAMLNSGRRRKSKRRSKGEAGKMSGWYKYTSPNGHYFSPFAIKKDSYVYAGPGDRMPTPAEAVELLHKHENIYANSDGLYFTIVDAEEPGMAPQDLPGGAYIHRPPSPSEFERLAPMTWREDHVIELSDTTARVTEHIQDFISNESMYKECGLHKLGILMYGPPGNGKSSLLRKILKNSMPKDAVVIFLDTLPSSEFLMKLQATLKGRLKVFVFEEMITAVDNIPLHLLLSFLDGELSVDGSITLGTTNYPERLPANIVDRPSRFDALYEVGNPKPEDRATLLKYFTKKDPSEELVAATADMSIAAIKEAVLYARLKKVSVEDSIKRLKDQSKLAKKAFAKPGHSIGFFAGE